MYVITWRFQVKPQHLAEFKKEYGPDGSWATLFRRGNGYVKTDLIPSQASPTEFTTVDYWKSKEDFDRFKSLNEEEYERLDRQFAGLTTREERIRRTPPRSARTILVREFQNAALILFGIA